MHEGIRDTSAQDVLLSKTNRWRWLKWAVPVAVLALAGLLLGSVLSTWLSAEASVSTDRIRTAVVSRGDLVRDLNVQGRVVAAVSPTLYSPATGTVTLQVLPGDRSRSARCWPASTARRSVLSSCRNNLPLDQLERRTGTGENPGTQGTGNKPADH